MTIGRSRHVFEAGHTLLAPQPIQVVRRAACPVLTLRRQAASRV